MQHREWEDKEEERGCQGEKEKEGEKEKKIRIKEKRGVSDD